MSTQEHPDTRITGEGIKERKLTRELKCTLTAQELADTAENLTEALQKLERVNADLDSMRAEYKAKQKLAEAEIQQYRTRYANKFEMRPVDCIERKDFEARTVEVFRTDTGEIVDRRELTQDDIQRTFPGMCEPDDKPEQTTSDVDGEEESLEGEGDDPEDDGEGEEE